MPKCKSCSSHVSDRFERVFADRDGDVYACPNCSPRAGIAEKSQKNKQSIEVEPSIPIN